MPSGMYLPQPKKGVKLQPIAYTQQNRIKEVAFPVDGNIE